jgi:GNAT superfamily N-acetyltransferase
VISIEAEPFTSPDGVVMSERYAEELTRRFDGGYDPTRGLPATDDDLGPPWGLFLIARLDAVPVGCGGFKRMAPDTAEVKHLWVAPEHRGLGVARRLLEALEDAAVRAGYRRMVLDTSRHLTEAVALYHRSGYVEIAPYNQNEYAHHWFEKHLSADG